MTVFSGSEILKRYFFQILAAFTGTVSVIADGMQYGWSAPIIPILESKDSPVEIQKYDVVWLENIYMLGAFAGIPLTIALVDRVGRKRSMLIAAVVNLIGWTLIAVASSVEFLYVGRFLTGIASNFAFVASPMYIAEIADEKIRGFLSCFGYLMMLVGILVIYSVGPFVSILVSSIVGACFLVFQLSTFSFMPESPYYLLMRGNEESARKSLQRLRNTEDVTKEFDEIRAAIERQSSEKGRLLDLVLVDSNRKAMIIVGLFNWAQHFSGISVLLMNIHTILEDAASILTPSKTAIIFSLIMLIAAISAACLIDKVGRKILLTCSSLLTGIALLTLATYFAVKNAGFDVTKFSWVPVVSVMVYAAAFKGGLGIVPSVLAGELFPTSVKAIGMTIGDASYVLFAAISIYLYQFLVDEYGMHVPFFIFSAFCLMTTLFVVFYVPETKGKTLEEIQLILKGNVSDLNKDKFKYNTNELQISSRL